MKKTIIKISVTTLTVLAVVVALILVIKDSKTPFISKPSTPEVERPNTCNCLQHIKKIKKPEYKILNIKSGYVKYDNKFIAKNKAELLEIGKINNCDFSTISVDDVNFMNDDYVYFVEFVNTTASYEIAATKFILSNDRAYFNTFDESKLESTGKTYASVMGGFCFIAMVPANELSSEEISETNFTDRDGNIWRKSLQ